MGFDYTKLTSGEFKLPSGWRVVTVQDVAVVNEQNIQKKYKYEIIEYIDVSSVEKGLVKTTKILPLRDAPSRARRIVRDQDILISTVRPSLQHYAFIKKSAPNTVASTGFAVVTAKQVEPRYLYYYLTSKPFTEYLTAIAESHTSAYPAFNPDVIEKAELLLPPNSEQRAIAHILGTLDDKIELNRQMNETLEAMAQAIFKSWFVDFDPVVVNAIKAGNPIPDKYAERAAHYRANPDSLSLPGHILRLFPDHFVDSDLGPIPEGWEVGRLSTIARLQTEIINPRSQPEMIWEHYSIPAYDVQQTPRYERGNDIKSSKYKVPPTAVLASKLNPQFPRIWLPEVNDNTHAVCSTEFMPFTPVLANSRPLLYELMKSKIVQEYIRSTASGSTGSRQRAKPKDVTSMPVVVAPANIFNVFNKIATPIHGHLLSNRRESRTLIALRDRLLPNLVSGKLRIPDARRVLESVV